MKKLHFSTPDDFEKAFKKSSLAITDTVVESIEEAMQSNRRSAHIFTISFEDMDIEYDISLGASQWVNALNKCLEYYHEFEQHDKAIDTWKLQEAAKVW